MLKTGENYPWGPCELPLICSNCGHTITRENVIVKECSSDENCEMCEYCGPGKCPNCGNHWHCGGCI